jgi:DprA winged helix domain
MMSLKLSTKEHVAALREENCELARVLYDELREKFSSREACLAELCRTFQVEQRCNSCFSLDVEVIENGRAGKCFQCKNTTWFTSGTILEHIKKPEARLAAIFLTSSGVVLNSVNFSKLVHISQSSALGILNWLRITVLPLLSPNSELVHSSHFSLVFCRRSRETPAGAHPVAEQQAMEEMEASLTAQSSASDKDDKSVDDKIEPTTVPGNNIEASQIEELESQRILHLLALTTESLSFDQIHNNSTVEVGTMSALLTRLEMNDQVKRLPGDYYLRNIPKPKPAIPNKQIVDAIADFIHFVESYFGGISRRYLQPYLAAFWIYKAASNPAHNRAILQIHNLQQAVNFNSVKDFVTPLWVNFSFS